MKRVKLFEQFIREFVENSELSFENIKSAEQGVNSLISAINEYFLIDEDDVDETVRTDYEDLLDIRVFGELNNIINNYYGDSEVSFYDNLQRVSHLLKDMAEQYDYQNVEYSHKDVDSSIDGLVNSLNEIIPFTLNKLTDNETSDITTKELEVMESIKESINNKKGA
jgi:hypothetical protein